MKKCKLPKSITIALAIALGLTNAGLAQGEVVQVSPKLQPDPLVVNGTSGGTQDSNCGKIAAKPSQVIRITQSLPYLRLTVESGGKPTLLIDGPGGRFCVLADTYSGGKPEISGFWQEGNYALYVGELSQGQYNYTLSISQQKPNKSAK
ncbi:hypothetical protein NUACC21_58180 [Scytonema sp. NUACC21]